MVILSKPSGSSRIYFEDHDKVRNVRDEIISCMKKLLSFEEVHKEEMCDVKVGLCPIVSRAGTDIEAALSRLKTDKPVIMMVLHHTFDHQATIPKSSRYDRDNLLMMVDILFHEDDGLLKCPRNEEALNKAADHIKQRYPPPPASNGEQKKHHETPTSWETFSRIARKYIMKYKCIMKRQDLQMLAAFTLYQMVNNRQHWLVWIACLIITLYDEYWLLWVLWLSVTLYTARLRTIQHSLKKHWFLWAVCTAVTLYNKARRH